MLFILILIPLFFIKVQSKDYDIEILPDACDCRDWYGGCRVNGEEWTDDEVWMYRCTRESSDKEGQFVGCRSDNGVVIKQGNNETIDGLWHSCTQNEQRLKYEIEGYCVNGDKKIKIGEEYRNGTFEWLCLSTGKWITGCYYFNETHTDLLLRVGDHAYNGRIEHICAKRQEYPAIVQYYTQVRNDVDVKHPTNKGVNRNYPEPLQSLIKEDENIRWLHNSAEYFIKNDVRRRQYIRYLPLSRKPL